MTVINRSMFPLSSGINNIMSMKERYDKLQTQLSSGQKASNLGEMGSDRYFDLALRARVSRIESYQSNIKTVNLRLNVLDQTVSRLDQIESDARAATMAGSGGQASLNFQTTPTLASARFDEVMTLMNVDIAGRYLFGGAKTEAKPVEDAYYCLNGRGSQAGFKQVAGERKQADLGTTHMGRLTVGTTTDTTTLAEDGAHPFGMKLASVSTTSANINVTQPAGSPKSLTVQMGATQPAPGDTVTFNFTMPDGTSESITMTATTVAGDPGSFVIGPDADTTAANFNTALQASVKTMAEGKMVSASAYAASENFFYGQGGQPMRVDGPPYDTATALVAGTSANTIYWYKGEDSTDPRQTVTAKVGESTSVNYGVQANESGLVNLVQTLAAMSIQTFTDADTTSADRYSSMVSRNTERLAETGDSNGSIAIISVELGLAKSTAGAIDERHTDHKAQLGNMVQDIEEAPTETVAMELLALKTRLEASYQTTSMLSQLSLVNYLK
jgi:flagellin-like hook-associated protein FlgL